MAGICAQILYYFGCELSASSIRVLVEERLRYSLVKSETIKTGAPNFLEKTQLMKLKLKAMRAGVWFRGLARIDRVLVDLTLKVADSVRSPHLAQCILSVAGKLEGLLESRLERAVREFGLGVARRLSVFAQKWGNSSAVFWAQDPGFARYWAVMKLNRNP